LLLVTVCLHALRFREHEVGNMFQLVCRILESYHALSERWFVIHIID